MRKLIERLIEFSATNKLIVCIGVGILLCTGVYAWQHSALDALPDLSDTQVIVYSRWDRSPDIIEDQVTYPIITALLGAPRVKAVRGFSDFGFSYVYVIFEEGTDVYWARSRVLEYLSKISARLPEGVQTELGPDATGIGWVFQYALLDTKGNHSLDELRSFQDWYLRYYLQSVPGVAEVAPIGGFVRQYQVTVDPQKLQIYNISLMSVIEGIRKGNNDAGGRLLEVSGTEYMVRARGYARSIEDIERIVVGVDQSTGTPLLVKNVAQVVLGPEIRRGVADLDGKGDVVGGIVVMRDGESALQVIENVKKKLKEIEPGLPEGVKVITTYDRTDLIHASVDTVSEVLLEDFIVVGALMIYFLMHIPSAIIPILLLPIAAVIALIPLVGMKITLNIMSITGIVLAIGDMVDIGVCLIENVHARLHAGGASASRSQRTSLMIEAMKEVGPTIFSSLLVTVIGLSPLLSLEAQEGRLFRPLILTQMLTIFSAALLSITLVPALIMVFLGKVKPRSLEDHWLSKKAGDVLRGVLGRLFKKTKIVFFVLLLMLGGTVGLFLHLGSEFMPPLYEGSILYMPTTLPGLSVTEAQRILQKQDSILKSFPEVERVFGKAGRVESSTDPAPFSMMETTVILKPYAEWRTVPRFRRFPWITRRITYDELVSEMDQKMQFPGITNAWTMPIKARVDMLSTGVRTPIGIKIMGADSAKIEQIGMEVEKSLRGVKGTRSVYAERTAGGYFVDIDLKRDELARYGLSIDDAEMIIMSAVGGENISTTIEGRERYPIHVRYPRELRDDVAELKNVLVPTMAGAHVPLGTVADVTLSLGPAMIRNENGLITGYVYVDVDGRDIGGYVREAKEKVRDTITLPQGYSISWSGQYENIERIKKRLSLFVPFAIALIFLLYHINFRSSVATLFIMGSLPFVMIGSVGGIYLMNYNLSIAVWAGMVEVFGISAALCALVITFLFSAYDARKANGGIRTSADCEAVGLEGASRALRPALMTCTADIFGLLPALWATGVGADFIKRYTAPIIFGLTSSLLLALIVIPLCFVLWKKRELTIAQRNGITPA